MPPLNTSSQAIAAGNLAAVEGAGISRALARQALASGFGAVMLYGATAAFALGLLSLLTFRGAGRMAAKS